MKESTAKPAEIERPRLRSDFFRVDEQVFAGYVVDEDDIHRRFAVELIVDGYPLKVARADAYADELAIESLGDACYGFEFYLPGNAVSQASVIEARVANLDIAVGLPIFLAAPDNQTHTPLSTNEVTWLGGLRFEGWSLSNGEDIPVITAIVDGERIAEAKATRWANVGSRDVPRFARRFDINLPEHFADGRVKRVQFVRESGEEFPSNPLTMVAFPDGLRQVIDRFSALESERPRGKQFDRILPMAIPFTEYTHWLERFPVASSEDWESPPVAIALVGPGDPEPSLGSLGDSDYPDWVAAALPETIGQSGFDAEQLQEFLAGDAEKSEIIVFTHAGTRFEPLALHRIAAAFKTFPDAVAVYGDFDINGADGLKWPIALPAFDYERMIEQGYCAHLFALRRGAVAAAQTDLYQLLLSSLGNSPLREDRVIHIPGSLATLAALDTTSDNGLLTKATRMHLLGRKIAAHVTESTHALFPASRVVRSIPRGSTTIVIPVRNQIELLRSCLRSIEPALADGDVEILIVDNDSADPEMITLLNNLDGKAATVLRAPGPFNFARLNNIAAEKAKGEFLCLLNNDVQATDDQWLREMLGRMCEEDVGAVGALLLWPSGVVQHGGTVLGSSFAATHAFCDRFHTDSGYADLLCVAHECSAVTAACLLTRRSDYLEVGGMDEVLFPVSFNDVDYCLKLRAKGKRIVFTPHARLLHLESASRGDDTQPDRAARFERELRNLRARWGEYLIADPYYSPILSLDATPFSALAWPPRDRDARIRAAPVPAAVPPGF
jgi:O-antigen biosynthesis protein